MSQMELKRVRLQSLARILSGKGKLTLMFGGASCTDLKSIILNHIDAEIVSGVAASKPESWLAMKAAAAHESAHIRFTSHGVWQQAVRHSNIMAHLLNIIEDARIERAMSNLYPGTLIWFRFMNDYIFLNRKDWGTGPKALMGGLISHAVVGRLPVDIAEQKDVSELVFKCAPHIDKGRFAPDTKTAYACAQEVFNIIRDFMESFSPPPVSELTGSHDPEKAPDGKLDPRREPSLSKDKPKKPDEKPAEKPENTDPDESDKAESVKSSGKDGSDEPEAEPENGDKKPEKDKKPQKPTADREQTENTKAAKDNGSDVNTEDDPVENGISPLDDTSGNEPEDDEPNPDEEEFDDDLDEYDKTDDYPEEEFNGEPGDDPDDEPGDALEDEPDDGSGENPGDEFKDHDDISENGSGEDLNSDGLPDDGETGADNDTFGYSTGDSGEFSDDTPGGEGEHPAEIDMDEYTELLENAETEISDIESSSLLHEKESARTITPDINEEVIIGELSKGIHIGCDFKLYNDYPPVEHAREAYETIFTEVKPHINKTINEIRRILEYKATLTEKNLRKGRLSGNSLWKLQTKDPRVFCKTTEPNDIPEISIYLLVDCSGSMAGTKIDKARKSACLLYETCAALKIPVNITGFSAEIYSNRDVTHYRVIKYTDSYDKRYLVTHLSSKVQNRDGYSIRVATKELLLRNEQQKVLIVLSDGLPCAPYRGYVSATGFIDTAVAVREAEKQGIGVIGLFFGSPGDLPQAQKIYNNCIYVSDVSVLPLVIGRVLKKVITSL